MNCLDCGACCKYVVIPMEGFPEDAKRWLAMHEGLKVVGNRLFIAARCKNLRLDNSCAIYADRPDVCRDYLVGGEGCIESRALFKVSSVAGVTQFVQDNGDDKLKPLENP